MNKWFLMAIIAIAVLINLYLFGKKSVHQEILIEATPMEVWKVLTDIENIRTWNKVLVPIEGELKEGEKITYKFHQDANSSSTIPARVKQVIPAKLLNQTGGMTGVLTFDHQYILEAQGEYTRFVIHEEYRGIAVPFWSPKPVGKAYGEIARALENRMREK